MFRDFFKNILGAGTVLGVDIGTASIKVAEVGRVGEQYSLVNYGILSNYGHFERANEVIQTSTMQVFDKEVTVMLKKLVREMKTRTRRAVAGLPIFSSFTTLIEMPDMNQEEMKQAVGFKAKQYIPLPLSEVTIDWLPMGARQDENGKTIRQILLVAVPTEKIKQYRQIFTEAGLQLLALEVETLAVVRALIRSDQTPTIVLDIGSQSTALTIVDHGFVKSSAQVDYASNHLTRALAQGLNINMRRAEEMKKQKGLLGTGAEFELSTIMFPFTDVILKEVMRAKERYEESPGGAKIERVILAGGGANMPGLATYAEKQLGLPVIVANPFLGFKYKEELEPAITELSATLSVAVGLAMREI